ncbi:Uncharacterised protein [Segatella copri]|nr:Uncharacterised protein [Segatella copri]
MNLDTFTFNIIQYIRELFGCSTYKMTIKIIPFPINTNFIFLHAVSFLKFLNIVQIMSFIQ